MSIMWADIELQNKLYFSPCLAVFFLKFHSANSASEMSDLFKMRNNWICGIPAIANINPNLHIWVNWTTTDVAININMAKLLKYDGYNVHTLDSNANVVTFAVFAVSNFKWSVDDEHIIISMRFITPIVPIDTMAAARRRIVMSLKRLLSRTNVSENIYVGE